MVKLHIAQDGTPKQCIAKPGNCPLAHSLAHFSKLEDAESFADEYNEHYIQTKENIEKNIENLDTETRKTEEINNWSLGKVMALKDYIEKNKSSYDDFDRYKNPIKWQKQQRNKYLKNIKEIEQEQTNILTNLEKDLDKIDKANLSYKNATDSNDRALKYRTLKNMRNNYKNKVKTISEITMANVEKYNKNLDKKITHEAKLASHLKDKYRNMAFIDMHESCERELELRSDDNYKKK